MNTLPENADDRTTRESGSAWPRLVREALALRELNHEYVVKIHGAGREGDLVYLAMELIDGQTLKGWQSDSTRSLRDIVTQYGRIGTGLAAAHDAGLVHRDFKPNNVMINRQDRPRVLDFGLARRTPLATAEHLEDAWEEITQVGVTVGTPSYMAPEQVRGESLDARSDQFSFCIALYEAATHEHPFQGGDANDIMRFERLGVSVQVAFHRGCQAGGQGGAACPASPPRKTVHGSPSKAFVVPRSKYRESKGFLALVGDDVDP